jgi:hypothetical protein
MHVVIRSYSGASSVISEMVKRSEEVEKLISSVEGFIHYYALGSGDHLTTVTICEGAAGTAESTRRAAAFIKETLPSLTLAPPRVTSGDPFVQFGS